MIEAAYSPHQPRRTVEFSSERPGLRIKPIIEVYISHTRWEDGSRHRILFWGWKKSDSTMVHGYMDFRDRVGWIMEEKWL